MPKRGYKQTKEHKEKVKIAVKAAYKVKTFGFQKGHKWLFKDGRGPMSGKKHSEKTKDKMRKTWQKIKTSHPNWKGGISKNTVLIRNCFKYRQWRSDIFTRDDFTCVLCNKRGDHIEADHYPKSFAQIINEYNIRSVEEAISCEELWNINNGRTLCKKCHHKPKTKTRISNADK